MTERLNRQRSTSSGELCSAGSAREVALGPSLAVRPPPRQIFQLNVRKFLQAPVCIVQINEQLPPTMTRALPTERSANRDLDWHLWQTPPSSSTILHSKKPKLSTLSPNCANGSFS